tara:strand:- start:237 stop:407 length:171 start_codon:yes stop_codon:yes gene_type:complete
MKFNVYNKSNKRDNLKADVVMTFNADNLERAIDFASQIKKMEIKDFLKIFVVKEIK